MPSQSVSQDLIECVLLVATAWAILLLSLACFMLEGWLCKSKTRILYQFLALFAAALFGLGWLGSSVVASGICLMEDYPVIAAVYVAVASVSIMTGIALYRAIGRRSPWCCPHCNFNVFGNQTGVCPDCGMAIHLPSRE